MGSHCIIVKDGTCQPVKCLHKIIPLDII